MLEARAVSSGMIVGRIHAPRRQVFTGYVSRNKRAAAVCRHDTMSARLNLAHNHVGIVDGHVLIIHFRFATAQEIGQVNRQKADTWEAFSKLIGQELSDIDLLAVPIGIGRTNFWYGYTQIGSFLEDCCRRVLRILSVI